MARARIASSLVALWVCQATAGTSWAQSQKPPNLRLSGAFCGTAYFGSTPQFSWPADNAEIYLMPADGEAVVARASTDSSGEFKFSNVPRGVYRVGLPGFMATYDTVEVSRADQRDCKQRLFVMLYLRPIESDGLQSRIAAKRPPNFANATTDVNTKERGEAIAEVNAGLTSEHDLDTSEQHFRAAVRIDPTYWLAHVNLALVLVDRQQLTQAEAEFREAVRVGGKHEVPYWQLTTFLVDHGRAGDADSALNQAQRNGISSAGVNASRGLLAFQNHQWKEAEKQFRAALEFTPEALFGFGHWMQWDTLLAVALSRQGKSRETEAQQRIVLEAWGHDPWVLNMIGYEMVERGDHVEEAVRMLEEAVAAEPGNAGTLDSLGWANFKLRRFAVAEPQLKQAAASLPDHSTVLEHLGELYAATGRKDAARSTFAAALEHATEAEQRKRLSRRLKQVK